MAEYQIGLAYSNQAEYDQAIQAYRRALELNPNFEEAHIGLTGTLYRKGDKAGALAHIEELEKTGKSATAQALKEWIKKQETR